MNEISASEMFIYFAAFSVPVILIVYYFVIVARDYVKKIFKKR